MSWFVIALLCAFLTACSDAVSKRIMQQYDEWATGAVLAGLGAAVISPMVLCVDVRPPSLELGALLVVLVPFEVLGYYLFLSALRMAPLSLTVPLLAFTPLFAAGSAWLLLGERVNPSGAVGILLISFGAFILNADLVYVGLLAPVKAIFSNPGAKRMLWVALIWSFTTTMGKIGAKLYGPIPFGFLILCGVSVVFGLVYCYRNAGQARDRCPGQAFQPVMGRDAWKVLALGGFLVGMAHVTHFVSLSMANVSYMISIKRLSLVFGVFLGWKIFGEQNIRYRLIGAAVMVCGVFFLYQ